MWALQCLGKLLIKERFERAGLYAIPQKTQGLFWRLQPRRNMIGLFLEERLKLWQESFLTKYLYVQMQN